jgi:hypothetical protein
MVWSLCIVNKALAYVSVHVDLESITHGYMASAEIDQEARYKEGMNLAIVLRARSVPIGQLGKH